MAREYGWTPQTIRDLTYQEFVHYYRQAEKYRETIWPAEITLTYIRKMLAAWLGVKEKEAAGKADEDGIEREIEKSSFPTAELTKAEKEAWIAAKYPPLDSWLRKHRREKK